MLSKTRRRALLALPAAAVVALVGTPAAMAVQAPTQGPVVAPAPTTVPAPTTQGIIMRDGGVCDPIRHMGC
jgi:hypothetical protein